MLKSDRLVFEKCFPAETMSMGKIRSRILATGGHSKPTSVFNQIEPLSSLFYFKNNDKILLLAYHPFYCISVRLLSNRD